MKRNVVLIVCLIDIVTAAFLHFYTITVLIPRTAVNYYISPLQTFEKTLVWPSFWLSLGVIVVLCLFKKRQSAMIFVFLYTLSVIAVIIYLCLVVGYYWLGISSILKLFPLLNWVVSNVPAFLVPGLFIGAKIQDW